jgi:hypothetical protein
MVQKGNTMTDNKPASELPEAPEHLYAVVGEWGVTPFVSKETATSYPGPRMFECSPRTVVEYAPVARSSVVGDRKDAKRLETIRADLARNCRPWYNTDIAFLLSLIPTAQPAVSTDKCLKCGHRNRPTIDGTCQVWIYYGNP